MLIVSGNHKNYQNGAVINQLTGEGRGEECVGGVTKSVDV
jgi:hypothetical protein